MAVYNAKAQSDVSLDNLKFIIVVRVDMQNKDFIGDTWSPKASTSTLKYFLEDSVNNKAGFHQLDFIG